MIAIITDTLSIYAVSTCTYVCPGDLLTYECTITGGNLLGATTWTRTAFSCSSSGNEIILLHAHSMYINRVYICNNGTIMARILSVEDNNYTSQLNVTVTPDTAGKTIKCLHDNGSIATLVFSLVIPTTGLLLANIKAFL